MLTRSWKWISLAVLMWTITIPSAVGKLKTILLFYRMLFKKLKSSSPGFYELEHTKTRNRMDHWFH